MPERPRAHNSTLPAPTAPMKRTELRRGAKPKGQAARRRAALRKARDFERTYLSVERVVFVRYALTCAVAYCCGLPECAHLSGEGTGRKGHYTRIVPLCRRHHRTATDSLHNLGSVEAFDARHGTDLEASARQTEVYWLTWGRQWIGEQKLSGEYALMARRV